MMKFETIEDVHEIATKYVSGTYRVGTLAESAARYVKAGADHDERVARGFELRELAAEVPQPARDVLVAICYAGAIARG